MKALNTQPSVLWFTFRALLAATILSVSGIAVSEAASAPTVPIDQQPLIVAKPLAPNIVLMLDDSGSMASDFMPDGMSSADDMDFRASSENGTYYNPDVLYVVPPQANSTTASPITYGGAAATPGTSSDCTGTSATSFAFPCGWYNGFDHSDTGSQDNSNGLKDITNWSSDQTFQKQPYFVALSVPPTSLTCPSGYTAVNSSCVDTQSPTITQAVPDCGWFGTYDSNKQVCYSGRGSNRSEYPPDGYSCASGEKQINETQCASCPSGYSYSADMNMCVDSATPTSVVCPTGTTKETNDKTGEYYCDTGNKAFAYSTGSAGALAQNLVALDCMGASRCHNASDPLTIDGVTTTYGQNVANWFTYYRTRILMAKSGLMSAFSNLDSDYRVGFGSIDGSNVAGLGSNTYLFSTDTNNGSYSTGLAKVNKYQDGTTGTQKANLWSWLVGVEPSGYTPLRGALNAVGQYYETAQPWLTDPTNSADSASSTNAHACRQAYTILTTDGYWNGNTPNNLGDQDSTKGPTITGPNQQSYSFKANPPYADENPDTLADVAMKYWKHDLCPSGSSTCNLANEVPSSDGDPGFWQHMVTFTVGLGVTPKDGSGNYIDPSIQQQLFSWAIDDKGDSSSYAIPGFTWGTDEIADLMHAGLDGHGGFYSAKNPQEFASGIADALKRTAERVGTGASLAANSTKLDLSTVTYQATYFTGAWKGDLKAFAVDPNTGTINTIPTWTASSALPAAVDRNIWTYNPDGNNAASQYVAFKNTSGTNPPALSSNELTALGSDAATQATMVDYLRGDPTYENSGTLRKRDTPLGDIVDSQPIYVGAPNPNLFINQTFTGADKYAAFASTEQNRAGTIYVAANDGMLHAFDASTGEEVYAYLPAAVITNGLATLANKNYGATTATPHQFFNDGELTVADIYAGGTWKSILVGTTGRGTAKAIYALDVTDPTSIQFLWERSAGDGQSDAAAIGQMTGKPVIAQTANKHWQVLMGNGYNSADDKAELLAFNLTGTNGQIDTSGTLTVYSTDGATSNGLAAPGVWIDNATDGLATEAYAGDLLGRVWKFDLTNPGSVGQQLFTAKDSSDKAQPITAGLLLGKDPITNNVWAFFGTGKYLSETDLTDMGTQTWYGIIVATGTGQPSNLVANLANGRSALMQRSIVAEVPASSGNASATPPVLPTLGKRAFTPKPSSNDMSGESGWYIDLLSPTKTPPMNEGERMVTPNQFQGSLLLGTSRIPQAANVCNPTGRGWIMVIDPFTGTNPSSTFFDTNGDGQFDTADLITLPDGTTLPAGGVGFTSLPNNPIFTGNTMLVSFDNGTTSSINTQGSVGSMKRVSWREILNQ